jgi:hypothetical protein
VIVERRVDLPCSIEEAWRVLTRWEHQSDWMLDADEVRVSSTHRAGVGVRLDVRTRLFQIPVLTERIEVVGWDPPRSLAVRHGRPFRGRGLWELAPIAGGVRFTWTEEIEIGVPVVGSIGALPYAPVLARLMSRSQRRLRSLIVASGPWS